jgi:hypothetical protein
MFAEKLTFLILVRRRRNFPFYFKPTVQLREPEVRKIPDTIQIVSFMFITILNSQRIEEHGPACL